MKLTEVLDRNENIVTEKSVIKHELLFEIIPVADWLFFETNQGRVFTCKLTYKHMDENDGKIWEEIDFDEIKEGRHFPF